MYRNQAYLMSFLAPGDFGLWGQVERKNKFSTLMGFNFRSTRRIFLFFFLYRSGFSRRTRIYYQKWPQNSLEQSILQNSKGAKKYITFLYINKCTSYIQPTKSSPDCGKPSASSRAWTLVRGAGELYCHPFDPPQNGSDWRGSKHGTPQSLGWDR